MTIYVVHLNYFMIDVTNMSQKKLKKFVFDGESRLKGEQSSFHKHLLNNSNCAKNYNDGRFKMLSRARNPYHLPVLEPLFIKTVKPKICKQSEVYNLKLY